MSHVEWQIVPEMTSLSTAVLEKLRREWNPPVWHLKWRSCRTSTIWLQFDDLKPIFDLQMHFKNNASRWNLFLAICENNRYFFLNSPRKLKSKTLAEVREPNVTSWNEAFCQKLRFYVKPLRSYCTTGKFADVTLNLKVKTLTISLKFDRPQRRLCWNAKVCKKITFLYELIGQKMVDEHILLTCSVCVPKPALLSPAVYFRWHFTADGRAERMNTIYDSITRLTPFNFNGTV